MAVTVGRRVGRSLYVGRSIRITVSAIRGDLVDLQIEAPKSEAISRDDVPYDVHFEMQLARESGQKITPDEAADIVAERRASQ